MESIDNIVNYFENNHKSFCDYLLEVVSIMNELKIESDDMHLKCVFQKTSRSENKYLNIDYKILLIALFSYFEKNKLADNKFKSLHKLFRTISEERYNKNVLKLLSVFQKYDLIYEIQNNRYYSKRKFSIDHIIINYIINLDSIAIKRDTLLKTIGYENGEKLDESRQYRFSKYNYRNKDLPEKHLDITSSKLFKKYFL